MSTTAIKVDTAVRDRLAILARERGTTIGALLAEVTETLERQAFFRRAQEQLEWLRRADPAGWSADRAESRSWQEGTDRDTLSNAVSQSWGSLPERGPGGCFWSLSAWCPRVSIRRSRRYGTPRQKK